MKRFGLLTSVKSKLSASSLTANCEICLIYKLEQNSTYLLDKIIIYSEIEIPLRNFVCYENFSSKSKLHVLEL
ncbi:UNVERIFIED_CONTAM: hypothetical protein PYX00_002292 [Menopon gallinae]|uniref:Uncharacterized protein n=1 Tax=Menopon gallinae TaxID=328185 RepID=A0AAW2IHJ8_9NEOP